MNGTNRLERELTAWFSDTAAPRVPDYTADIVRATATMRQRPRWSFPTRWLPVSAVPRLPRIVVRPVPWRTIALIALLGLLLAAAVALYAGSRPRLPNPFGLASNGLVAYAQNGEIWTVDPVSGAREAIVTLPGANTAPRFSRDGTRIAFFRAAATGGTELGITNANGSGLIVSSGMPFLHADPDSISWSPDGRWVAVVGDWRADRTIYLVDASTGAVRNLETPNVDTEVYWRPPDGRQLMYVRQVGADGRDLVLVSVDNANVGAVPLSEPHLRPGGWTPSGERFVVHHWDRAVGAWTSLLDPETGTHERLEIAYGRVSNDGTRVVGYGDFGGDPFLCVMSLPDGDCLRIAEGDLLPDWEHTAGLHWSPDDRWIVVYPRDGRGWVLLNPEGGPPIEPVWSERGVESWQRVAPSGWWELW